MKVQFKATVQGVGGGEIEFGAGRGRLIIIDALDEDECAFGALLYREVTITIDVEPKEVQ